MCRIDKMIQGVTKPVVFFQHAALAIGVFISTILEISGRSEWSKVSIGLGILAFFVCSLGRWKYEAPKGTSKLERTFNLR